MKRINGMNLYSARDLSALLGLSQWKVREYYKNGSLGCTMHNGRRYTTEAELKDFLTK